MRKVIIISAWLVCAAAGQTKIDLYTQVKSSSKPVKTGTSIPGSCITGDILIKTDAPAGSNLYACVASNTWVLQSAASGGSGTGGTFTLETGGVLVGSRSTQNLVAGSGVLTAASDTGSRLDVVSMVDTAVVQTHATAQSGRDLYCESLSGSGQDYSCSMAPALSSYTKGMVINWRPDVAILGGPATLSIDGFTPLPLKLADGTSDPSVADVIAGQLIPVWYDGSLFRLIPPNQALTSSATRPACGALLRGRMWHIPGSAGVKDDLSACVKDATDVYAWKVIY